MCLCAGGEGGGVGGDGGTEHCGLSCTAQYLVIQHIL